MSRFGQALGRARSANPSGGTGGLSLPEEAPGGDVFEAPWSDAELSTPATADAPPAPAAEPVAPARRAEGRATPAPLGWQPRADPATPVQRRPAPVRRREAQPEESPAVVSPPRIGHDVRSVPEIEEPIAAEQYRRLADRVRHWQVERGGRVLMVTSARADEGTTLTAVNLAATLSGAYDQRVLLVDCNLRSPAFHDALHIPLQPGLSDVAVDRPAAPRVFGSRLFVLPAGRATDDPAAALTSVGVATLIEQSRKTYDWVILDAPPAAVLPDAVMLSRLVDGVVLVVAAGRTHLVHIDKAADAIGRQRIVGVVLNGVEPRDLPALTHPI